MVSTRKSLTLLNSEAPFLVYLGTVKEGPHLRTAWSVGSTLAAHHRYQFSSSQSFSPVKSPIKHIQTPGKPCKCIPTTNSVNTLQKYIVPKQHSTRPTSNHGKHVVIRDKAWVARFKRTSRKPGSEGFPDYYLDMETAEDDVSKLLPADKY